MSGLTSCSKSHLLTLGSKYTSLTFSFGLSLPFYDACSVSVVLFCFSIYSSSFAVCYFDLVYLNWPYALQSTTSKLITNPSFMWIGLMKIVRYFLSISLMFLICSKFSILMCWLSLISPMPSFYSSLWIYSNRLYSSDPFTMA